MYFFASDNEVNTNFTSLEFFSLETLLT
jgi:hypothetical protein